MRIRQLKNRDSTRVDRLNFSSYGRLLVTAMILSVALRLIAALYQGNGVELFPGIADQLSYDLLARRVADGFGFSFAEGHWPATPAGEPTAHWSYLYTLYLAAVYFVAGPVPLLARIIQAIVTGILHVWLAARLGRRLFGPRTGLYAAYFSAVYVYFYYYASGLLTESFYFVSILWTLDIATAIAGRKGEPFRWRYWVMLGIAIGTTVLLRQVFSLFVPFLLLWLWWNLREPAGTTNRLTSVLRISAVKGLAVSLIFVAVMILPWTVRNYLAFDTFVPLNTNAGFAFYWGNHPVHGTRFIPLLGAQQYRELIPPELWVLNEAELDRVLMEQALGFIRSDPARYIELSISRSVEYFKFWPSSESSSISNFARLGSFGLFLPLILFGLWQALPIIWRPESGQQRASVMLMFIFMSVYTGIHLASWTLIRYRLPVDVVLLMFASQGAVVLQQKIFSRTAAGTSSYGSESPVKI